MIVFKLELAKIYPFEKVMSKSSKSIYQTTNPDISSFYFLDFCRIYVQFSLRFKLKNYLTFNLDFGPT